MKESQKYVYMEREIEGIEGQMILCQLLLIESKFDIVPSVYKVITGPSTLFKKGILRPLDLKILLAESLIVSPI